MGYFFQHSNLNFKQKTRNFKLYMAPLNVKRFCLNFHHFTLRWRRIILDLASSENGKFYKISANLIYTNIHTFLTYLFVQKQKSTIDHKFWPINLKCLYVCVCVCICIGVFVFACRCICVHRPISCTSLNIKLKCRQYKFYPK